MWTFPARFLVEFFDNHGMLGFRGRPRWRTRRGGSRTLRGGAHRAVRRRIRLWHAGRRGRPRRRPRGRSPTPVAEPERFDARGARDALRSGARAARGRRASASASCSARSPTSPTRPCCTPTVRCCRGGGARGRAGTTTSPTARADRSTVTYHMNSLQSLRADREFCVTLNRTDAIDPGADHRARSTTPTRSTRRRASPRRRADARSAGATARTTAARTGAGASTRMAFAARCGSCASASGAQRGRMTASAIYEGTIRHRRVRRAHARVHAIASRSRTSISTSSTSCSAAACVAPRPGLAALPPPRLPRRSRGAAGRCGARRWSSSARAARRRARSALLTQLRTFGHCFNPVSFYYCFDAAGERLERGRGGGDEHAVGRAPRLCARARRRRGTRARAASRQASCTSRRSWAWTSATAGAWPTPGPTLSVHIESREAERRALRRDALAARAAAHRRRPRGG